MRWFGQVLRWRYEQGMAPPVDPSIVHVDITRQALEKLPTLELEYQNAATLIRQTTELGARVVAFDVVFGRGDPAMAEPILKEVERAREPEPQRNIRGSAPTLRGTWQGRTHPVLSLQRSAWSRRV